MRTVLVGTLKYLPTSGTTVSTQYMHTQASVKVSIVRWSYSHDTASEHECTAYGPCRVDARFPHHPTHFFSTRAAQPQSTLCDGADNICCTCRRQYIPKRSFTHGMQVRTASWQERTRIRPNPLATETTNARVDRAFGHTADYYHPTNHTLLRTTAGHHPAIQITTDGRCSSRGGWSFTKLWWRTMAARRKATKSLNKVETNLYDTCG